MTEKNKSSCICIHCGSETRGDDKFCCNGCKCAYSIINNLGLEKFYDFRKSLGILKTNKIKESMNDYDFSSYIKRLDSGEKQLEFTVSGISCSSCIWLIENALSKQENITGARVTLSSKKLVIRWNGDESLGNEYAKLVIQMGYDLAPYDSQEISKRDESIIRSLLIKIALAGFSLGGIMTISDGLYIYDRELIGAATHDMLHLIVMLLAMPVIIYSGSHFYSSAINSLRHRRANMDVPIAFSLVVIAVLGIYQTFTGAEHVYFDSAVMLIFTLLIGRYFEFKARAKARLSTKSITDILSGYANLITESGIKIIPAKDLKEGMLIQVNMGEKIPADGIITKGSGEFDTSLITGETLPKQINSAEEVMAGMLNLGNTVEVKISRPSANSTLSQILGLLEKTEKNNSKLNTLAEKATRAYVPVVYGAALITFALWYVILGSSLETAIINSCAVLIITCPCALGLAVPVVNVVSFGKMLRKGLILKNGETLERLNEIDTAIFDKTGTLTTGHLEVLNKSDFSEQELRLAASMASKSSHPAAKAIAKIYGGKLIDGLESRELAGLGLEAEYEGKKIRLGKPNWVGGKTDELSKSSVAFSIGDEIKNFTLEDELRKDAKEVISKINKAGIRTIILSGDVEAQVKKVAEELGIVSYKSKLLPQEKYDYVSNLKNSGHKILMVGDGLNDAPSIKLADVSISPGSAVSLTQNSADIIFSGERLMPVIDSIKIAKKSVKLIKQNIYLSFLYNFISIPFAMAGFITPIIASVAMSASSIIVVLNSLRLERD
jgi:Cu2+-exporting ATPase